ncbi:hypothetical protein [Streptomyces globisporus]|uniref:hypothetical protein n=1 Tax=Streptomyces globisporus TaxID=1908 RepID=UPI0004C95DC6|nr:hypothetical protein [Streptomyces globisporus]
MELSMRLKSALDALESPDLESRVRAVEELAACSSDIVGRVAIAFESEREAPHLIVERMGRFGSLMIPPLEHLYREAGDGSFKLTTASALLYMGSEVGVPSLMAAVAVGNPHLCMAAMSLADAGVSQVATPIERALMECELSDIKTLECLTSSLRLLRHPISEKVRLHLAGVEPKWLRDSLLSQ